MTALRMCLRMKSDDDTARSTSVSYSCVNELASRYFGKNLCLTVDNWFTSIPIAIHLKENGLDLVGTHRKNKVRLLYFKKYFFLKKYILQRK